MINNIQRNNNNRQNSMGKQSRGAGVCPRPCVRSVALLRHTGFLIPAQFPRLTVSQYMYVNLKQTTGLTLIYQKAKLTQFRSVKTKVAGRSYTCGCFQTPGEGSTPMPLELPPRPGKVPLAPSPGSAVTRAGSHTGTRHSGLWALVPAPPATAAFFTSPCKCGDAFLRKPTPNETTSLATLELDLQRWPAADACDGGRNQVIS